jgi:phytoene dehydrogenase-like protein
MAMNNHVAVIGAGAAGLIASNLEASANNFCTLFEAHSLPGGCASWFKRKTSIGTCNFDVGATVVPSFTPDSWWYQTLDKWKLIDELGYKPSTQVIYNLDQDHFRLRTGPKDFFHDLCLAFPSDAEWINRVLRPTRDQVLSLKNFVEALPQWPLERPAHAIQNLKKLPKLPMRYSELKLLLIPFDRWLDGHQISPKLRSWFEMNALISIQCSISDAYAMYALFAILFHSTGSGTFNGGMRRYFEVLLKKFRLNQNSKYLPNTKVVCVTQDKPGEHYITDSTSKRHGPFTKVYFSCPRSLSESLINNTPPRPPSTDMWSAMVAYLVVEDDPKWSPEAFNWHIKDSSRQDEIFASFTPRNDLARAPSGYRCVNISHHEVIDEFWQNASHTEYQTKKIAISQGMLQSFTKATGICDFIHSEFASPRTWQHFTQRPQGTVGGLPLSKRWTLFNTPPRKLAGHKTLLQIGDTSFPGQSLYSCALSAGMAFEF